MKKKKMEVDNCIYLRSFQPLVNFNATYKKINEN